MQMTLTAVSTPNRHPYAARMEELCHSLPCLRSMPSAWLPWDANVLAERWGTASSGEKAGIQFVLNVWNHHWRDWQDEFGIPPFTVQDFARLDEDSAAAVAAWFAAPFWP